MTQFLYRAVDKDGRKKTGAIQAETAEEARAKLEASGLLNPHVETGTPVQPKANSQPDAAEERTVKFTIKQSTNFTPDLSVNLDPATREKVSSQGGTPPTLVGYDLQNVIGEGGFGLVWGGVQRSTGQKVAVKVLSRITPEAQDSIRREVARLAALSAYPGVVPILDAALDHSPPYLVSPLLRQSLGDILRTNYTTDNRQVSQNDASRWLLELAKVLQSVHQQGFLHCDIKPDNVLLDETSGCRLADFGQALSLEEGGVRLGTYYFMCPEQARLSPGGGHADQPCAAWDIYSLGATIYTLVTGAPPRFTKEGQARMSQQIPTREKLSLYSQVLQDSPLAPVCHRNRQIDPKFAAILEKCLALNSMERYSRAEDLVVALEKWQSSGRPTSSPSSPTGLPPKMGSSETPKPDDYLATKYAELLNDYSALLSLIQRTVPGLSEDEQQRGAFEILCGQIWMTNLFIPKHQFNMRTFERSIAQALACCLEGPLQSPCVAQLALTTSSMDAQMGASILALNKDYSTYYRGPHLRNLHGQIILRLLEFDSSKQKLAKLAVATDAKDFVRRVLIDCCLPRVTPGSSEEQEKACNRLLLIVVSEIVDKSDRTVVSSMEILMEETGKHSQAPPPLRQETTRGPEDSSGWFGCVAAFLVTGLVVLGFIYHRSKIVVETDPPVPTETVAAPTHTPQVTAPDLIAKAREAIGQKDFNRALASAEAAVTLARKGLSVTNLVDSLACRAAIYEKLPNRDKAIADYEELRKLQPDDALFKDRLAACKKMPK